MTPVVSGWLLDTNVVSSRATFIGNPQVAGWAAAFASDLWMSVITVAEIGRGLELKEMAVERLRGEGQKREKARPEDMKAWAAELGHATRNVGHFAHLSGKGIVVANPFEGTEPGDETDPVALLLERKPR